MIAASLKEIVLATLQAAPCFGIQLDVTFHFTSQAQLIVWVRFPDKERIPKKLADHYIFCLPVGVYITASRIFSKVDNYFSNHEVMWSKCKAVSTVSVKAMIGIRCCSHKTSRTGGCECSLHHTPRSIGSQKTL